MLYVVAIICYIQVQSYKFFATKLLLKRENSQIWTHLIFQPDNKSETNLRFSIFKPFLS